MRPPRAALAILVVLATASATAMVTACGGGSSGATTGGTTTTAPSGPVVKVANFAFSPQSLTVHVGDTVTWEFHQPDAPHNVVSLSGPSAFNSGVPQGHGTFQYTFNATGTYTYDCQVHPNMTGTIIVTP